MPEHHPEEELYFGEDYYDEDDSEESDKSSIHDDPYAEAARLGRLHTKQLLKNE